MLSAVIRTARKWFCRDGEIGKFVISMFWLSVCLSFTDIAIQHPPCTAEKPQVHVVKFTKVTLDAIAAAIPKFNTDLLVLVASDCVSQTCV